MKVSVSIMSPTKVRIMEEHFQRLPRFVQEHSQGVAAYIRVLARELLRIQQRDGRFSGLSLPAEGDIAVLGLYHDIGKVGISDEIWESAAPLNEMNRKLVRSHTILGAYIVEGGLLSPYEDGAQMGLWEMASQCCLYHHERWDGTGYPFQLEKEQIPLPARMVGIADAFDAMTAQRPYQAAVSKEAALQEIRRGAGRQFDPELSEIFCAVMQRQDLALSAAPER